MFLASMSSSFLFLRFVRSGTANVGVHVQVCRLFCVLFMILCSFVQALNVRDHNLSIGVYRFCRVVFGLNASPFLLNGTVRHHLATFAKGYPEFVKRTLESFYPGSEARV